MDHRRQHLDQVARRRMIEAHCPADQDRRRPATTVAKELVAVADELPLELEDSGCGRVALAAQDVSFTVGDEREVSRPE
jgi:hypothetical protein